MVCFRSFDCFVLVCGLTLLGTVHARLGTSARRRRRRSIVSSCMQMQTDDRPLGALASPCLKPAAVGRAATGPTGTAWWIRSVVVRPAGVESSAFRVAVSFTDHDDERDRSTCSGASRKDSAIPVPRSFQPQLIAPHTHIHTYTHTHRTGRSAGWSRARLCWQRPPWPWASTASCRRGPAARASSRPPRLRGPPACACGAAAPRPSSRPSSRASRYERHDAAGDGGAVRRRFVFGWIGRVGLSACCHALRQ